MSLVSPGCSFDQSETSTAFLLAAEHAGAIVTSELVRRSWAAPSAVRLMTVGDTAAHVLLVVRRVAKRLENASDLGDPKEVPTWTWLRVDTDADLDHPQNRIVREDAERVAAWGAGAVAERYESLLSQLRGRLPGLPPLGIDLGGRVIPLGYYLATRVVELLTHADDLACSVGWEATPPAAAIDVALGTLVAAAREIHGDAAVLRAFTRRERAGSTISVF
jgi:hypothetical protein